MQMQPQSSCISMQMLQDASDLSASRCKIPKDATFWPFTLHRQSLKVSKSSWKVPEHIPKRPPSIPKEKFQYFELWQAQPRQFSSKITLRWVNFEAPKGTQCKQCNKMLQKLHHLSAAASSMQLSPAASRCRCTALGLC